MGIHDIDRYEFLTIPPDKLSAAQKNGIHELLLTSVALDFPDRTEQEVRDGVRGLVERAFGERPRFANHPKQSFANRLAIIATDRSKDTVHAYLGVADNVSSRLPKPLNRVEQHAKLHGDSLVGKRWRWLGMRALSPDVRINTAHMYNSIETSLLDVLGYLAISPADPRQPVSAYPWRGEKLWQPTLNSWGLRPTIGSEGAPHVDTETVFGEGTQPVQQEHWTAETVNHVLATIKQKDGAEQALRYTFAHLAPTERS